MRRLTFFFFFFFSRGHNRERKLTSQLVRRGELAKRLGGGGARRRGVGVASARVSFVYVYVLFARRRGAMQRRVVRLGDVAVVEHVAQPLDEPARGGEHGPRLGPAGRLAHERRGR